MYCGTPGINFIAKQRRHPYGHFHMDIQGHYTHSPDTKFTDLYQLLHKEMHDDIHWPVELCFPNWSEMTQCNFNMTHTFNPLPVQFKSQLHGQEGCVFFSGHLNLLMCQYIWVHLAWQATFKSSTFWYVGEDKGIIKLQRNNKLQINMTHTFNYSNLWKISSILSHLSLCCEQHYSFTWKHFVQGKALSVFHLASFNEGIEECGGIAHTVPQILNSGTRQPLYPQ
jgi:hypothetical protein